MSKYEKIAQKVYEKAEEFYKGSEINTDTLYGVLITYFNYTERTNNYIKNVFINWEMESCYE